MTSILEKFTSFICDLSYESIPDEAVLNIKRSFIDTVGVALSGSDEESSRIIRNYIQENSGCKKASIIAGRFKTSSADAALCNGVSLHALDYDDTGAYTQGHPSAPIFPAIISLAEENNNNGKEIIEAYVIGIEVLSRLSRLMPMLHLKGFHPTSVLGSVAAAAAAGKLLKLESAKIKYAIGIAASLSAGLIQNFGTMTKPLHIGNAARNGVIAAKLAQNNFSSSNDILDCELSFQQSFLGKETTTADEIINSIGSPLAVVKPGINIKKYPSCSLTHRAIDALYFLKNKYNIDYKRVESIECCVSPRAVKVLFHNNPRTGLEAKFSMQFVLAAVLYFNELLPSHFSDKNIDNPVIQSLMKIISLNIHKDWNYGDDARADIVTVTSNDGSTLHHAVEIPKGNVLNPLSLEEVIAKFKACSKDILAEVHQEETVKLIMELENQTSINRIIELISFNTLGIYHG